MISFCNIKYGTVRVCYPVAYCTARQLSTTSKLFGLTVMRQHTSLLPYPFIHLHTLPMPPGLHARRHSAPGVERAREEGRRRLVMVRVRVRVRVRARARAQVSG